MPPYLWTNSFPWTSSVMSTPRGSATSSRTPADSKGRNGRRIPYWRVRREKSPSTRESVGDSSVIYCLPRRKRWHTAPSGKSVEINHCRYERKIRRGRIACASRMEQVIWEPVILHSLLLKTRMGRAPEMLQSAFGVWCSLRVLWI